MIDGIYKVGFSSGGDSGSGLIVVSGGSLNGGDYGYWYQGRLQVTGNNVSTTLDIFRHDPNVQSVFGPLDRFKLAVTGAYNPSTKEFGGSGQIAGQPQLRISVVGKWLAPLA